MSKLCSGGPLLCKNEEEEGWTIHGITSFGSTCGLGSPVGVYTRVQFYISWIESICGANCELSVHDLSTFNFEDVRIPTNGTALLKMATSNQINNYESRRKRRQKARQERIAVKNSVKAKRIATRRQKRLKQRGGGGATV